MNCQKQLFSLPDDLHYLNCAYMSPMLKAVEEAGYRGIRDRAAPWTTSPADFFTDSDKLRTLFARIINAGRAEQVAILPSVSYGMATIAKNLSGRRGKKIVVPAEQFPSNVYPWMRFCSEHGGELVTVAPPAGRAERGRQWNRRILEAIDSKTQLVALGNIHWADGTLFDLEAVRERSREAGAMLVIDGTQSVGALPFDVQKIRPDALICAGYKWLMGPYSMALGFFSGELLEGAPLEEGWIARKNSEDFSGLVNYTEEYQPGAIRFDVGERSNFILVPMMIRALEQIIEWGPERIQAYCKNLSSGLATKLQASGYRIEAEDRRSHHMFGIRLPGHVQPKTLQTALEERHIVVSVRGGAVRISPNVYNDQNDISALAETLTEVARNAGDRSR